MGRVVGVGLGSLDGWEPVHKRPALARKPASNCLCKVCGEVDLAKFSAWHASLCRPCSNTKRRARRRNPPVARPALEFPQCKRCRLRPDPGYLVGGLCPMCRRERAA